MSRYEFLIFDFDGTIADSESVILDTMRQAFESAGIPAAPDAIVRARIGLDLHEMVAGLLEPEGASERVDEVAGLYRDRWLAGAHEQITLFDGIVDILEACLSRGQELCIATGKSRVGLERSLVAHDLERFFTAWATPDQVERGKPHPDMVELLLSTRPYERSQVLMIGDSTLDLDMGHAAGVDTCAVAWGTHDEASLRSREPAHFTSNLVELSALLSA